MNANGRKYDEGSKDSWYTNDLPSEPAMCHIRYMNIHLITGLSYIEVPWDKLPGEKSGPQE